MRRFDTVIFDLDGTLLDTLEDLADSTNYALRENGFPTRSLAEVQQFVGNGVARLIHLALPARESARKRGYAYRRTAQGRARLL